MSDGGGDIMNICSEQLNNSEGHIQLKYGLNAFCMHINKSMTIRSEKKSTVFVFV